MIDWRVVFREDIQKEKDANADLVEFHINSCVSGRRRTEHEQQEEEQQVEQQLKEDARNLSLLTYERDLLLTSSEMALKKSTKKCR